MRDAKPLAPRRLTQETEEEENSHWHGCACASTIHHRPRPSRRPRQPHGQVGTPVPEVGPARVAVELDPLG